MLNQNIKKLRKDNGYSQETLAQQLNVVRQTVSKWEKGYSVPDAVMLERIAELFDVSVDELLGAEKKEDDERSEISRISMQLSILNEQFAKELSRKKRIRKIVLRTVLTFLILTVLVVFLLNVLFVVRTDVAEAPQEIGYIVEDKLDKAISKAILSDKNNDTWLGEFLTEEHFIFGTEEEDDTATVYLMEEITSFGFLNGFFTDVGGHIVPAVFKFKRVGTDYELLSRDYAEDGSLYTDSIKKLFPKRYAKKVLKGLSDTDNEIMWLQSKKEAQNYLMSIGRSAEICHYGDIVFTSLKDYGVSAKVIDKLSDLNLNYDCFFIGNREEIENKKRYVYQTDYVEGKNLITFTKFEFETAKVVEYIAVDVFTGKVIKNAEKPKKALYKTGKKLNSDIYETTTMIVTFE